MQIEVQTQFLMCLDRTMDFSRNCDLASSVLIAFVYI